MRLAGNLLIVLLLQFRDLIFLFDYFNLNNSASILGSNSMWPTFVTWIFDLIIFNYNNFIFFKFKVTENYLCKNKEI